MTRGIGTRVIKLRTTRGIGTRVFKLRTTRGICSRVNLRRTRDIGIRFLLRATRGNLQSSL